VALQLNWHVTSAAHLEEVSDTGWVDELILQSAHLMSQEMGLSSNKIALLSFTCRDDRYVSSELRHLMCAQKNRAASFNVRSEEQAARIWAERMGLPGLSSVSPPQRCPCL
jgi:hypothetical protein